MLKIYTALYVYGIIVRRSFNELVTHLDINSLQRSKLDNLRKCKLIMFKE